MPIVEIEDEGEGVRRLVLSTGDSVRLKIEDDEVGVYAGDEEVGRLSFRCYEMPVSPFENCLMARLTHAFIEGGGGRYKRHGVGSEAVRYFIEATDHQLELPEDDGMRKDDGSHLVNDGPRFVARLRALQLAGKL